MLDGALANAPLGATITLDIAAASDTGQALQVPAASLYDPGNGPGVWVVAGEPAKVAWRPVRVVGIGDQTARVDGRLSAGEQVVALGAHLLHDDQEVRVAQAPAVAGSQP